jgi:hypothetical protein
MTYSVSTVNAEKPSFFVIEKDANLIGDSGWYSGYVVTGTGSFELRISASGDENVFPCKK